MQKSEQDQTVYGTDRVLRDIANERKRQVVEEGYARLHDDEHVNGELIDAAACYCVSAQEELTGVARVRFEEFTLADFWPWEPEHWKPKSPREDLVRAAALIIAEIERLDRMSPRDGIYMGEHDGRGNSWCTEHKKWESPSEWQACDDEMHKQAQGRTQNLGPGAGNPSDEAKRQADARRSEK